MSPTLGIARELLSLIEEHARSSYPDECCGLLIGSRSGPPAITTVEETMPATNEREDENRHNRYLIHPRVVLEADRTARAEGREIVGYYHSHPDHPSRPSAFDREHAWPDTSYLIVSVRGGEVAGRQSWRLLDDRSGFSEEEIDTR